MSSISGPCSSSSSSLYSSSNQPPGSQAFKALANALQNGDLAGAQSAFASLPQNAPTSSSGSPFSTKSKVTTDLQNLSTALQSGNLADAQKALASLQTDMKAGHKGHHHHGGESSSTDVSSLLTSTSETASTTTAGSSLNVTV